jgi:hypothetical protein
MQPVSANLWAILACVVIRMGVGALWYSPKGFLKPWLKMSGVKEKQMNAGMGKAIGVDLVFSLILVFILLHAIRYALPAGSHDVGLGLAVSFLNWLGFVAAVQSGVVTYEKKPFKYFLIVSGYQLVTILLMGVVLTLWN